MSTNLNTGELFVTQTESLTDQGRYRLESAFQYGKDTKDKHVRAYQACGLKPINDKAQSSDGLLSLEPKVTSVELPYGTGQTSVRVLKLEGSQTADEKADLGSYFYGLGLSSHGTIGKMMVDETASSEIKQFLAESPAINKAMQLANETEVNVIAKARMKDCVTRVAKNEGLDRFVDEWANVLVPATGEVAERYKKELYELTDKNPLLIWAGLAIAGDPSLVSELGDKGYQKLDYISRALEPWNTGVLDYEFSQSEGVTNDMKALFDRVKEVAGQGEVGNYLVQAQGICEEIRLAMAPKVEGGVDWQKTGN